MCSVTQVYDALAGLLAYPDPSRLHRLAMGQDWLARHAPEAAAQLDSFGWKTRELTTEQFQELYTQTFDINPVCSLEVGWQLFGENYSRGEFLVEMRQTLRRLSVPESTELPDHLTHVLAALGRMPAGEADRFASRHLLPALEKMVQGLAGKDCPYELVLRAVQLIVRSHCGAAPKEVAHG